ncbi:lymphotoxin beta receptor inhibitor-like [Watersipora subatra]|uniref:lymphotoxin beta receptor inhibitor-like n=1 Tax=Watersipora subatra TaxID=2589382 RepID=UPI00355C4ACE
MTDIEKDWYYFRLHDTDADMRLDGLELFKAWQHHYLEHMGHAGLGHTDDSTEEGRKFIESQNETFMIMVDKILEEQDIDNDGYLDYFEYMLAKEKGRREEEEEKNKKK